MAEDQDWRLRAELADAVLLLARLRDARHFEHELTPLVGHDIVLSYDDDTLFAYANTHEAINEARRAIEHQLASDGLSATLQIAHWDDDLGHEENDVKQVVASVLDKLPGEHEIRAIDLSRELRRG